MRTSKTKLFECNNAMNYAVGDISDQSLNEESEFVMNRVLGKPNISP